MKQSAVGLTLVVSVLGAGCATEQQSSEDVRVQVPDDGTDTAPRSTERGTNDDRTDTPGEAPGSRGEGTIATSTTDQETDPTTTSSPTTSPTTSSAVPTSLPSATSVATTSTTVAGITPDRTGPDPPTPGAATTTLLGDAPDRPTTTSTTAATAGGPAGSSSAPDAAAIEAAFAAAGSSLDVSDGGGVLLTSCPLDPDDTIVPALFGSLDLGDSDGVEELPVTAGAFDVGQGFGTMIYCDRFPDVGDEGVGVFAINTPDDFETYTAAFADPDGVAAIEIEIAPLGDAPGGGDLLRICVTAPDDPGLDYCEIDWAIGAVTIGAYMNGALADSVDLDAFAAAFAERSAALASALVAS